MRGMSGDTRTQEKSRSPWLNVAPGKGEDKNNQGSVGSVYCQHKYGFCTDGTHLQAKRGERFVKTIGCFYEPRFEQPGFARHSERCRSLMPSLERRTRWVSWSSFIFALLQSLCTAVLTISGIRVLIGLGALAAAAGTDAPAKGFHRDAIRIPMMVLALVGALINLYVLWRQWSLRRRPASQWRLQPLTVKEKRSQWLQFVLAIVTLVLLGLEWWTHPMIHHPHHYLN